MSKDEGLALLGRARSAEALTAALSVIAPGMLRVAILQRYDDIKAEPRRLDADCGIRAALLRGLRQCALATDIGLLEDAVQTYEFGARGEVDDHGEVVCNLRAAGLLALAVVDEPLAAFHATRLLADAPAGILLDLAERWQSSSDEIALLGMFDTLLGHPALDRFSGFVMRFIEESPLPDLVAYLAAAIVAGHSEALIELLAGRATLPNPRGQLIRDCLALRPA